jgi:hypothetical protein
MIKYLISILCFLLFIYEGLAKLSLYEKLDFIQEGNFQCYNNVSIHGLILARKGSKGIRDKNLVAVGRKSILRRSVETMTSFKSKLLQYLYITI